MLDQTDNVLPALSSPAINLSADVTLPALGLSNISNTNLPALESTTEFLALPPSENTLRALAPSTNLGALLARNAKLLNLASTEVPSVPSIETLLPLPPAERRLTLKRKRKDDHSLIKTNKIGNLNDTFANIQVIGNDIWS